MPFMTLSRNAHSNCSMITRQTIALQGKRQGPSPPPEHKRQSPVGDQTAICYLAGLGAM
jgi:hypothetical protein